MSTYQVNQYDIDINQKRLINAVAGGYELDDADKPRLYFDESVVWALNCYDRGLVAAAFALTDTWELFVDIDFDHDAYAGTLENALTTAAATTSIVVNYASAPTTANPIADTGGVLLRNGNNNRERVAYTAVANRYTTQVTYTVNQTLNYAYATGDYAAQEDPLMVESDDDVFNVSGDWASLDVVNGKISVQVDCTRWDFQRKITDYLADNPTANEVPVRVEIKKYAVGQSTPSIILQDLIYAKPTVRDIELAASVYGPNWSQPDARYAKLPSLYSTATGAVEAGDLISYYDASVPIMRKGNFQTVSDFVGTKLGIDLLTTPRNMVIVGATSGTITEVSTVKTNATGQLIVSTSLIGTTTTDLHIQKTAKKGVAFFASATSGDTREIKLYGRRTGDSLRTMAIGVGTQAANRATFDGVGDYGFNGGMLINTTARVGAEKLTVSGDSYFDGEGTFVGSIYASGEVIITSGAVTGLSNVGVGSVLSSITTGSGNTSIGAGSGSGITSGNWNVYVGASATPSTASVSNEIVIGYGMTGKGPNTVSLGTTSTVSSHVYGALRVNNASTTGTEKLTVNGDSYFAGAMTVQGSVNLTTGNSYTIGSVDILNVSGKTELTGPAQDDILLINDASASNTPKKIKLGYLRMDLINNATSTSTTLALTDIGVTVWANNSSDHEIIIPTNAGVAFPTNSVVAVVREGAGITTIKATTTDVTLNGVAGGAGIISDQFKGVTLVKRNTNAWVAIGAFVPTT